MKNLFHKQDGLTFIGLCFILAFIAILVTFTLRVFPLYNEKFQVISAMNSVASRPDADSMSLTDIRKYFLRNIQVTNIERFSDENVKDYVNIIKPAKRGEPKLLHVQYQATNKLVADLQLLLIFDEKMPLRGPGEGE